MKINHAIWRNLAYIDNDCAAVCFRIMLACARRRFAHLPSLMAHCTACTPKDGQQPASRETWQIQLVLVEVVLGLLIGRFSALCSED